MLRASCMRTLLLLVHVLLLLLAAAHLIAAMSSWVRAEEEKVTCRGRNGSRQESRAQDLCI